MILEIAEMIVKPGSEKEFAEAHAAASGVRASRGNALDTPHPGCRNPDKFVLLVEWNDIAAHERYRDTEQYAQWRAAIGPHVAGPAAVQHTRVVA